MQVRPTTISTRRLLGGFDSGSFVVLESSKEGRRWAEEKRHPSDVCLPCAFHEFLAVVKQGFQIPSICTWHRRLSSYVFAYVRDLQSHTTKTYLPYA